MRVSLYIYNIYIYVICIYIYICMQTHVIHIALILKLSFNFMGMQVYMAIHYKFANVDPKH